MLEYDSNASGDDSVEIHQALSDEGPASGNEPEQTFKVSGPDTLKYDAEFVDLSTHLAMHLVVVQFYKDSWKMYNENQAPRAKADAYERSSSI